MKVYADTPDHKVFVLDKLVVLVWRRNTTMSGVAAVRKAARDTGPGLCLLTIVHADTPPPPPDVRDSISDMLNDFPFLASAVVHEGYGVRQAMVMSVAVAVSRKYKLPFHHKVFNRLGLAFAWLKRYYSSVDLLLTTVDREGH